MDDRSPDTALALLERARAGDKDAFGLLAEEHRQALLRLCYKMTGSHEEAEDLVQETLLKAYTHIADFELRVVALDVAVPHRDEHLPRPASAARSRGTSTSAGSGSARTASWCKQMEQSLYLSPERVGRGEGGRRDLRQLHHDVAAREAARRDRPVRPDRTLARGSGEVDRRVGRVGEDGAAPRAQEDDRRLRARTARSSTNRTSATAASSPARIEARSPTRKSARGADVASTRAARTARRTGGADCSADVRPDRRAALRPARRTSCRTPRAPASKRISRRASAAPRRTRR